MSSKAVRAIAAYLQKKNITFEQEVHYSECKDQRTLPFDFILTVSGRQGLIEFDGIQHFEIVSKFHGTDRNKLRLQQKHDRIKTRFCFEQRKSFLRISYLEEENFAPWIDKFVLALRHNVDLPIYVFSNYSLYHGQVESIPKMSSSHRVFYSLSPGHRRHHCNIV